MSMMIRSYGPLRSHMPHTLELEWDSQLTGSMLLDRLGEMYPEALTTLKTCRVASGSKLLNTEEPIPSGEMIALLPPSSGG